MNLFAEKQVREIAVEHPSTVRVFERFGIDYCCGGKKSLRQACGDLQLSVDQVLEKLEQAAEEPRPSEDIGWQNVPLAKLADHIVSIHHSYVRSELPRLLSLAEKVRSRHGSDRPALATMEEDIHELQNEMTMHMMKEENILFPHIKLMERSIQAGLPIPPAPFGTVANPVRAMIFEHDAAGELLKNLRDLSEDYTLPADACPTYHAYFQALKEFEQDMHQHIHLENNVLFPRALAFEEPKAH